MNLQYPQVYICGASSEFASSSIPSWQILTAYAQPFRGARDLVFCLKVPLDSLLVWASSGGSGETARMHRLAWTFAARKFDKYQIRLTQPIWAASWQNQQNGMCAQGRQISLGIRPVWSEFVCAQRVAENPSFLHADSGDSDKTGWKPRLIWVFAGSTCHAILLGLSLGGSIIIFRLWFEQLWQYWPMKNKLMECNNQLVLVRGPDLCVSFHLL